MRQAAALGALTLFAGRPVAVDQLIDAVWGDDVPPSARRTLQSHLSRLRSGLGDDVVLRDRAGYRLGDGVTVDAVEFERDLRRAQQAVDHTERLALLEAGLASWRGEPYPELADWPPAVAERARLAQLREAAEEDHIDAMLGSPSASEAVAGASALVARQPLRERRWELLMRALYQVGRQADALSTYQQARARLIEEVGVEPGPQLRALERAILEHDPSLGRATGPARPRSLSSAAAVASPERSERPGAPGPLPRFLTSARGRDPLVGRPAELAAAVAHLRQSGEVQRPSVVVLRGEPGIGKTRLAAEIADTLATGGAAVLASRCREGSTVSYGPLMEALGERSDGLWASLGTLEVADDSPEQLAMARRRAAEAFGRALPAASSGPPPLVLLDDAQWADAPTLESLRWVLEDESAPLVSVLLTVRDTELSSGSTGLLELLSELPRLVDTLDLVLGGVDRAAAEQIVRLRTPTIPQPADIDWLYNQSGGSPLYLIEMAMHSVNRPLSGPDLPITISDVVRRRVSLLSPAAGDLVVAGAVLGEEFDIRIAAAMVAQDISAAVDHAAEAVDGQLLTPEGDTTFRFSHGVTRRAVEAVFATSRLLSLHWAAGALLEQMASAPPHDVAEHLLRGAPVGDPVHAARAALVAVSTARDELDPVGALRLLTRAGDLVQGLDADERAVRAEVLLASASLITRQGRVADAKSVAGRAADLARSLDDPTVFARATIGYTELVNAGEPDPIAPALCREALGLLGEHHDDERATVLAAMANYHSVVVSDTTTGRELADAAFRLARSDDARAEARWAQACALLGAPEVEHRAQVAHALRSETRPGQRRHVEAVRVSAHTCLELGDRRGYAEALDTLSRLGRDHGSWDAALWAAVGRAQVAVMEGRIADAEPETATLASLSGGSLYAWSIATIQDCYHRFERDDLGSMAATLEVLSGQFDLPGVRAMLVQSLVQAGESDAAAARLDRYGVDGFADLRQEQSYTGALALLLEAALELRRTADVQALARRLEPYSGRLVVCAQGVFSTGAVDRYLALGAVAAGDVETADGYLASAEVLEAATGSVLGAGYTALASQWRNRVAGDPLDDEVLDDLRRRADGLGLLRLRRQVDAFVEVS